MGATLCCDNSIRLTTDGNSEMIVQTIEPDLASIDKSFDNYPFINVNSDIIENSSEKFSERFRFP